MRYEFTGETKVEFGVTLWRIRAKIAIGTSVKIGDLGGWIEKEENLSQVYGNAWVYGNARVSGNAWVYGNARVYGSAWVNCPIFSATRSDGYTFVIAPRENNEPVIIAGCRYFTCVAARRHWMATRGDTQLGDESLALVDHLERMARIAGWITEAAEETKNA